MSMLILNFFLLFIQSTAKMVRVKQTARKSTTKNGNRLMERSRSFNDQVANRVDPPPASPSKEAASSSKVVKKAKTAKRSYHVVSL